jgi:hypothetical protein
MATLLIPPRIVAQTNPGSTDLTKITFRPVTPELIEAMGNTELKSQFLAQIMEARAVGVTPNTLAELLMSRIEPIGKKEKLMEYPTGTTFISAPFKYRKRDRNTKVGWFNITAGVASPSAGTTVGSTVYPASSWRLNVTVGPSPYATAFKNLARFFIPGHFLYVEHYNPVTNAAYTSAHKIVAATDTDADNAAVTVSAVGYTNTEWNALNGAQKRPYQPTFGAVSLGANNVSDYESFGTNLPTDLAKEMLIDWFGNIRTYRSENQEYLDALAQIMDGKVNEYLSDFQQLEMAKRNKQVMTLEETMFLNTIFFGARESGQVANPELADILNLPVATDPEAGTPLERKANVLGIHTQLVENNRRVDLAGAPFDLDLLFEESHNLKRTRRLDGQSHDRIVWMTDRWTKDNWDKALIDFMNDAYGANVVATRYVEQGKVMVDGTNIVAFEYTVYQLPRQHLELAIFTHEFFEDKLLAFTDGTGGTGNYRARGRMAVAIDWDDIKLGVAATNQVKRTYKGEVTANANSTWSKVMKMVSEQHTMRSKMVDVEFGDFGRHSIFENFSDACPVITARKCSAKS